MNKQLDIVFVNTNSSRKVYQDLSDKWTAIEPPTWSLLLAESCRSKGFNVGILDAIAENLSHQKTAQRLIDLNPRYVCFTTYSQNPNGGTTNMVGVYEVAQIIKENSKILTISIGSHTAALPQEVISNPYIDYVSINEGVYLLHKLLGTEYIDKIPGLGYKARGSYIINNGANSLVPQERMDIDLPGYAWDLLPYKNKPLDLYRAHIWHAEFQDQYRTPFASIYTSLGCKFRCNFCMINTINRTDSTQGITAADSNNMRFWSPEHMIKIFDELVNKYGVSTIRVADEMFFLNKKYYEPLLILLRDRGYGKQIKLWTYARVDTVNERFLDLFRSGGVKWLALGIEAANQEVRREIYKGKFQDINIRDVVKEIKNHDMYVVGNYIFGHSTEKAEHLEETLKLALELNCEFPNIFPAMALPGSPLYYEATKNGLKVPSTPEEFSFHSYECLPTGTKYLTPAQVLKARDDAWHTCFSHPPYLKLVEEKFGLEARNNIIEMSKIKLKRKILE